MGRKSFILSLTVTLCLLALQKIVDFNPRINASVLMGSTTKNREVSALGILLTSQKANAANSFISVVNPVRISQYNRYPAESLASQYSVIKSLNLPATWLLSYDSIDRSDTTKVISGFDGNQELGIFLEVTENFASKSGVKYNATGSWHFSDSVFLAGYSQNERQKLVDTVFSKFFEKFNSYPKTIGSWWVDSYTLDYINYKYGVTSVLSLSDQHSTDNYQVWGQYWSTPYYPNKFHLGIPANSHTNKRKVVVTQWAPRDPLYGYQNSLYSTQDYLMLNLSTDYFKKLVDLYSQPGTNQFGHLVVGLESDLSPNAYIGEYLKQMKYISDVRTRSTPLTLSDFSEWYMNKFPDLSPVQAFYSDDILGKNITPVWYQSPLYRIGIIVDKDTRQTLIRDFRVYHSDFMDPYDWSPVYDKKLSINIPSVVDTITSENSVISLETDSIPTVSRDGDNLKLSFSNGTLVLEPSKLTFTKSLIKMPSRLVNSSYLKVKTQGDLVSISPESKFIVDQSGYSFADLDLESKHLINAPKQILNKLVKSEVPKLRKTTYGLTQTEIQALEFLKTLPDGKILVKNDECIGCEWTYPFMPSVFANHRSYVKRFSHKEVELNSNIDWGGTREEIKKQLKSMKVKYIYLVKHKNYTETVPYSPGDLGIKEIYSNANSQIWEVID